MKKLIPLILVLFVFQIALAQKKIDTNEAKYFKFAGGMLIDIRKATPAQLKLIAIRERFKSIADDRFTFSIGGNLYGSSETLALRFQQNTGAKVFEGVHWRWGNRNFLRTYLIDGNAAIEFADVNITEENAKNYRYHVITNDNKEIVGWTTPHHFIKTKDGKSTYAYLGSFEQVTNGFLKIEIYNVNDYSRRDGIIIDWRPIPVAKINIGMEYNSQRFGSLLFTDLNYKPGQENRKNFIVGDHRFHLADSLVRLNISIHTTHNYNINTTLIRRVGGKTEQIDLGFGPYTNHLYKEYWKKPGIYELVFTPRLQSSGGTPVTYLTNKAVRYKFEVLPDQNAKQTFSTRELALISIILCAVFGGILGASVTYLKKKNQQKLTGAQQQKEIAKSNLSTIRSQLNPHFMFNALAGIQNLMNKNKIDEANRYLGKFARLTRNVLDNKELVSLEEERTLLQDYLEMEQLRFGFNFDIKIAKDLDVNNIEIPAMLLQPFVENAVKHGIADLETTGQVAIVFERNNADLILKITDNGKGFDTTKNYEGFGLQLSKNRISLLSTIYKETPIVLDMKVNLNQTTITITLTQWL